MIHLSSGKQFANLKITIFNRQINELSMGHGFQVANCDKLPGHG